MQQMLQGNKHRLSKRMRWAGRLISSGAAAFLLVMLIGAGVSEFLAGGLEPITLEVSLLVLIGAIAVAGAIVSWWRERLAGILLVLTAIGFGIHIGFYAARNHVLVWLMLGLPYLVAGGLVLASWWVLKKPSRSCLK